MTPGVSARCWALLFQLSYLLYSCIFSRLSEFADVFLSLPESVRRLDECSSFTAEMAARIRKEKFLCFLRASHSYYSIFFALWQVLLQKKLQQSYIILPFFAMIPEKLPGMSAGEWGKAPLFRRILSVFTVYL